MGIDRQIHLRLNTDNLKIRQSSKDCLLRSFKEPAFLGQYRKLKEVCYKKHSDQNFTQRYII